MFGSSIYSLGGTGERDPKCLRQYLFIPEDQLKILNSLPEWSKDTDTNAHRLIKGTESTILSSQASQLEVSLSKHKENIELFNKYLESRQESFLSCKFLSKKRCKSFSDFGNLKPNQHFLDGSSLIRTYSTSNIREHSFCLSSEKIPNLKKHLPVVLEASKELFPDTFKKNILSVDLCQSPLHSQSSNKEQNFETMEVITPQTVNVTCSQRVVTSEVTAQVQESGTVSCVSQVSLTNVNDSGNKNNGSEADSLVSTHKNSEIASASSSQKSQACDENEVSNMKLPHIQRNLEQETSREATASVSTNSINENTGNASFMTVGLFIPGQDREKKEINPCNQSMENGSAAKSIETNLENQNVELQKEISVERHSESVAHSSDNHLNINQVAGKSCPFIDNAPSVNQAANDNSVTSKRKSESKRSSKRQKSTEKKGNHLRSVKKAADISFSKEEIESMFNILKNFL